MYSYKTLQGFPRHFLFYLIALHYIKICLALCPVCSNGTNSVFVDRRKKKTLTKGTDAITKVGSSSSLDFDMFLCHECYLTVYLFLFFTLDYEKKGMHVCKK